MRTYFHLCVFLLTLLHISCYEKGHKYYCGCHQGKRDSDIYLNCTQLIQSSVIEYRKSINCSHYRPNHLVITESEITTLNATLFGDISFPDYDTVSLRQCGIVNISQNAFEKFYNLKNLDLSFNHLNRTSLRQGFKSILKLNISLLVLNGNDLRNIANDTFEFISIHVSSLQLSNNNITDIEAGALKELVHLKKLNLNNNRLRDVKFLLVDNIQCRLSELDLSSNEIRNISVLISASHKPCVRSLRALVMDNNPIKTLDPINSIPNLTTLYLQKIPCRSDKTIGLFPVFNITNLTTLVVGHNNISCWGRNTLSKLPRLTNLDMAGTKLVNVSSEYIETLLSSLKLERLNLKETGLRSIPLNLFVGMQSLTTLILNNNNISSWTLDTFRGLRNLHRLYLHDNNITMLSPSSLPNVQTFLDLSNNPWDCKCGLADFVTFKLSNKSLFFNEQYQPFGTYRCFSPFQWKDVPLDNFRPEYTDCNPFNPYVITAFVLCAFLVLLVIVVKITITCRRKRQSVESNSLQRCLYTSLEDDTSHEY